MYIPKVLLLFSWSGMFLSCWGLLLPHFTMYVHTYCIILCNVIILIFLQSITCVSCAPGERSEPRPGQCCPACVPSTYICLCVEWDSEAFLYQQLTVVRHFDCNSLRRSQQLFGNWQRMGKTVLLMFMLNLLHRRSHVCYSFYLRASSKVAQVMFNKVFSL